MLMRLIKVSQLKQEKEKNIYFMRLPKGILKLSLRCGAGD